MNARALHFVFKTTNRQKMLDFYVKQLGMKVLRHEEFDEGCKATCNGPFAGRWSKSMIGFGPEDDHFVFELVYNYGLKSVTHGNEFVAVVVESANDCKEDSDPDGYAFRFVKTDHAANPRVQKVVLNVQCVDKATEFWSKILGMKVVSKTENSVVLSFGEEQTQLELVGKNHPIKRDVASGRIAFACPTKDLAPLQEKVKAFDSGRIQNELTELDTPGKARVTVVILTDPDGHEICFVGDEAFRELSQVDPKADEALQQAIQEDWSDEWAKNKPSASS